MPIGGTECGIEATTVADMIATSENERLSRDTRHPAIRKAGPWRLVMDVAQMMQVQRVREKSVEDRGARLRPRAAGLGMYSPLSNQ
jgi:hypothetical protein